MTRADSTQSESQRLLTPEERRWVKRLQRVLNDQPIGLLIYCHGHDATVLDAGNPAAKSEFDKRAAIMDDAPSIRTRGWMAGDF